MRGKKTKIAPWDLKYIEFYLETLPELFLYWYIINYEKFGDMDAEMKENLKPIYLGLGSSIANAVYTVL